MVLNCRGTRGSRKPTEAVKWGRVALRCTRCVFIEKKRRRKKGKERKKPRWRERGWSGERAEPVRPRDPGPGRRALGGPEAYYARACPSVRAPARPDNRARAAQIRQVGKSVRSARVRRAPHLQSCLPGAQARRAPRRRGRTCRTRRSTFLKAVRPPYVVQCPLAFPAAGQWLSSRVPFHSPAPRPRPERAAALPTGHRVCPRGSRGGPVGQPSPPSSFLFSGLPSLLLSLPLSSPFFTPFSSSPDLSPPYPASPHSL